MHRLLIVSLMVLGTAMALFSTNAMSQEVYRWVDKEGVVHYGDRVPEGVEAVPMNVKPNTVQTFRPKKNEADDTADGDGDADVASEEPVLSYAEQRRQEREKRRKDYTEEARKLEANCEIMRRQKAFVEPSTRVLVDDGKGGTRRLTDAEREDMLNEANNYLAENCD